MKPLSRFLRYSQLFVGPAAIVVFIGMMVWRSNELTEMTTAEVVEIEVHQGSNYSTSYCPTWKFELDGEDVQVEGNYCASEENELNVGDTLEVRYQPGNPETARPNTFWAMYGEAFPLLGAGIFFIVLSVFVERRRRKRAGKRSLVDNAQLAGSTAAGVSVPQQEIEADPRVSAVRPARVHAVGKVAGVPRTGDMGRCAVAVRAGRVASVVRAPAIVGAHVEVEVPRSGLLLRVVVPARHPQSNPTAISVRASLLDDVIRNRNRAPPVRRRHVEVCTAGTGRCLKKPRRCRRSAGRCRS